MTVKICRTCGKKFAFSFGSWSEEILNDMNKEFKEHEYYCEKNQRWIEDMIKHYQLEGVNICGY
jgi:hypothetical protein